MLLLLDGAPSIAERQDRWRRWRRGTVLVPQPTAAVMAAAAAAAHYSLPPCLFSGCFSCYFLAAQGPFLLKQPFILSRTAAR